MALLHCCFSLSCQRKAIKRKARLSAGVLADGKRLPALALGRPAPGARGPRHGITSEAAPRKNARPTLRSAPTAWARVPAAHIDASATHGIGGGHASNDGNLQGDIRNYRPITENSLFRNKTHCFIINLFCMIY